MIETWVRKSPLLQKISTRCFGWLARQTNPWVKNYCITRFAKRFNINLDEALYSDPAHYKNFNEFFSRRLKPGARAIAPIPAAISPVDGFISAIGSISGESIFQAKAHHYTLSALLAGDSVSSKLFEDGVFTTLYLSPKDYHRVHMPFNGRLLKTVFVPGSLFSVNAETVAQCPNLFARNERLICYFETDVGPMAIILVGALNVSSIFTSWSGVIHSNTILHQSYEEKNIHLERGDEVGGFLMGSTVIMLMTQDRLKWDPSLKTGDSVVWGQRIGDIL